MIREAIRLITERTQDAEHERAKGALYAFLVLSALCLFGSVASHFQFLRLQVVIVLQHCIAIAGALVSRVLLSRSGSASSYPFCFGLYRVRAIANLAGLIFVGFASLSTLVEAAHSALHTHYNPPTTLILTSSVHAVLLLLYHHLMLSLDRVCGRPATRYGLSADEEHIFSLATSVPLRLSRVGGGQSLGFGVTPGGEAKTAAGFPPTVVSSPMVAAGGKCGRVSILSSLFSSVRLFLVPAVGLLCSLCVYATHSNTPDTVATLGVALYYLCVAQREGRHVAWGLLNNALRDPTRLNAIDRTLRSVRLLDGVLQVHSTAFFMVGPSEPVGFVRLRLMSGADAAAVTASSRRLLLECVRHAYVECFFPNVQGDEEAMRRGFGPPPKSSQDSHSHSHSHNHSHAAPHTGDSCGGGCAHPDSHDAAAHGHSHGNGHADETDHHNGKVPPPQTTPTPFGLPLRPMWDTAASGSSTGPGPTAAGAARVPLVPPAAPRSFPQPPPRSRGAEAVSGSAPPAAPPPQPMSPPLWGAPGESSTRSRGFPPPPSATGPGWNGAQSMDMQGSGSYGHYPPMPTWTSPVTQKDECV